MSKIISIATEVPANKHEQNAISDFADSIYCNDEAESRKLKFLYRHSGIQTRYSIIPDYGVEPDKRQFYAKTADLEPFPTLEKRMQWYDDHAASLSVKAIENCIAGKLDKDKITHLITVSCTGMSAPGLDLEIMEKMALPRNIFRTCVNFMGCYAAIHALKIADAICRADEDANVVIVCTEFCTLHFQKEVSIDNITSTLLFADGCAAVLMQSSKSTSKGINLNSFFSDVAFKGKTDMSWKLSSTGFLMTLSGYVPDLVQEDFDGLVSKALNNAAVNKEEITHWCIHPGGKKILEAIEKSISLPTTSLHYSYEVLNDYGNMSSPTILFVLQKILNELQEKAQDKPVKIFGAAFGPGLTMETFIASYD
ncbi:MAG: type III polyketide synthase [Ferruginibacter sp.]